MDEGQGARWGGEVCRRFSCAGFIQIHVSLRLNLEICFKHRTKVFRQFDTRFRKILNALGNWTILNASGNCGSNQTNVPCTPIQNVMCHYYHPIPLQIVPSQFSTRITCSLSYSNQSARSPLILTQVTYLSTHTLSSTLYQPLFPWPMPPPPPHECPNVHAEGASRKHIISYFPPYPTKM